jgi:hypothetical protein
MSTASHLNIAIQQIQFSREYMSSLLNDIDDADWFTMPAGCSTHVAWQIGHLAMAEYGLCLFRQRGRAEIDSELMTSRFRKQFSRGSQPVADPTKNPTVEEIRDVLNRVHAQAMQELPALTEATLDEPVDMPYSVFPTKLGALFFCAQHEMIHAGQIGFLRRLLGKSPIR